MIPTSLEQISNHRNPLHVLDEILSALDDVLEYNPKTGDVSRWAW